MWRRTDADKYFIDCASTQDEPSIYRLGTECFHPCGLHINIFNILRDGEREQREA